MRSFEEVYNDVIDENGCVRLCTRELCKELIAVVQEQFGISCGDSNTGMLNLDVVGDIRKGGYLCSQH